LAIQIAHEPDAGYRLFKDNVSVLLHAAARVKHDATLTSLDVLNYFKRINQFLQTVGAYEREDIDVNKIMRVEDFPDLDEVEFYKFLPGSTVDYYRAGKFQFGSVQFYRDIENQSSRDRMEGLANIIFHGPKHDWAMSLASGYNFGMLCGTSSLNARDHLSGQFGAQIIKIANLRAFAEEVKVRLGAKRYYLNHVSYNDLKLFRTRTLNRIKLSHNNAPGNSAPDLVTDAFFNLFYERSFFASLFMKPTRFAAENELRLVFEMPTDIAPPGVLRLADPTLLKHIEFL
jgi:hypothetical protein